MSFFRNENDPRYAQLFSMLKLIDVMAKLELFSWSERMPAVFALLEMKKALDEVKHDSITRRHAQRVVPPGIDS